MKIILLVLVVVGVACGDDDDLRVIDSIVQESACRDAGGSCTIAVDCPVGQLAETGLCPTQQKRGVECCYGISIKETRCEKVGGRCERQGTCAEQVLFHKATDCSLDQECCILLF